jgi:ABC-type multidrug transport system fused ATPase/permease subunit
MGRKLLTNVIGKILDYADQVLLVDQNRVTVTEKSRLASNDQISGVLDTGDSFGQEKDASAKNNETLNAAEQQDAALAITAGQMDLGRKAGDFSIYWYYTKMAGAFHGGIFLVASLLCAICVQFCVIWVQWWSDASAAGEETSVGYYLGIYALLSVGALAGLAVASWTLMVTMVSRSGTRLHQSVLDALFKAPASYFATIDQGITLNRFNQDMQLIDSHLPLAVMNTTLFACICLVQVVVVSMAAKYMAVTIPFCLLLIYFIQRYYLKTSRQLRLLDIEAKAPLCK